MIVNDLNIERVAIDKPKLRTPLIINPDRIPPSQVAPQAREAYLMAVAASLLWGRGIKLPQPHHNPPNVALGQPRRPTAELAGDEQMSRFIIGKRSDHAPDMVNNLLMIAKGEQNLRSGWRGSLGWPLVGLMTAGTLTCSN
jgi:hypothetical protein